MYLEDEFEDAGVEGGGDGAESGVAEDAVGIAKGRGVEGVEGFGAEFELAMFAEGEGFAEHEIEGAVAGAADGIAGTVAEGELRGGGEGVGVEPTGGGAGGGGKSGVGQTVGALDAEAGEGIEVGGLGDGHGAAGLEAGDAGDLPAAAPGEFVDEAAGKDVGDVAGRDVFFEALVEAVGSLESGDGACEDGGIEDRASIVDEAGEGVIGTQSEAAPASGGEAALEAELEGVVRGVADVVAVEGDVGETRIGAQELGAGESGRGEGGTRGKLAQEGIGD